MNDNMQCYNEEGGAVSQSAVGSRSARCCELFKTAAPQKAGFSMRNSINQATPLLGAPKPTTHPTRMQSPIHACKAGVLAMSHEDEKYTHGDIESRRRWRCRRFMPSPCRHTKCHSRDNAMKGIVGAGWGVSQTQERGRGVWRQKVWHSSCPPFA